MLVLIFVYLALIFGTVAYALYSKPKITRDTPLQYEEIATEDYEELLAIA